MGGKKTLATFVGGVAAGAVAVCAAPFALLDPTGIRAVVTVGAATSAAAAFSGVAVSLTGKAAVKVYHLTEDVLEKTLETAITAGFNHEAEIVDYLVGEDGQFRHRISV
ncbi:unnamed protein product [Sphagnum troendelagicum]|uniref:Uncharacterized protein n=1 Tax=Sphagnum troendelagicum TaxID=128251 RepID=A0ABP0URV5_9BRYO